MFSFLNNIPPVTKNILILNVLFYFATLVLLQNNIPALEWLAGHFIGTPNFKPYQLITHFFMHSPIDFLHLFFNMLMLVMLGSHLERVWGPKRFFILYVVSAFGSFTLFNGIGVYEIIQLKKQVVALGYDIATVDNFTKLRDSNGLLTLINEHVHSEFEFMQHQEIVFSYAKTALTDFMGASGAIFGIMAAFAYLFPNVEFQLIIPPIPVKAKYLVGIYFILEVYLGFKNMQNDSVAHFAHVGGAITGFALVYIWSKRSNKFY